MYAKVRFYVHFAIMTFLTNLPLDIKNEEAPNTKRFKNDASEKMQTQFGLLMEHCHLLEELEIWNCEK